MINDELEKVLEAEVKDGGGCRWDSHVMSKVLEGRAEGNNNVESGDAVVCPLQEYLFGSAVELSETRMMGKKENRTSLGELFQRSKVLEEVGGGRCEKEGDKYGIQFIKKKLKKKTFTAASKTSLDVSTDQTKLHKVCKSISFSYPFLVVFLPHHKTKIRYV